MTLAETFFSELMRLEKQIVETQSENIQKAADRISKSMMEGGVLHTFGIGHSFIPSKESFLRRGGLVPINPMYDANLIGPFGGTRKTNLIEQIPNYAPIIFGDYDVRKGEGFLQFSITGVSPLTVEISEEARRRGLYTIAVTNVKYSQSEKASHSSGKRLCDVADLVIDNCGEVGDAVVNVPGFDHEIKAGATATITAIMIWDMIFLQVIENYCKAHIEPPVVVPSTRLFDVERNAKLFDMYKPRLAKHF